MNSNIIISYIFIGITPRDILQPAHTAKSWLHFTFMHLFYFILFIYLADAFIQSDLQIRTL